MPVNSGFILINQVDICDSMHQKLANHHCMHVFVAAEFDLGVA